MHHQCTAVLIHSDRKSFRCGVFYIDPNEPAPEEGNANTICRMYTHIYTYINTYLQSVSSFSLSYHFHFPQEEGLSPPHSYSKCNFIRFHLTYHFHFPQEEGLPPPCKYSKCHSYFHFQLTFTFLLIYIQSVNLSDFI